MAQKQAGMQLLGGAAVGAAGGYLVKTFGVFAALAAAPLWIIGAVLGGLAVWAAPMLMRK